MAEKEKENEKPALRPAPAELKRFTLVVAIFALMNGMIGTFVQGEFAADLLVSSVVAVVANVIAPSGCYALRVFGSSLRPKQALIGCAVANVSGLGVALVWESLLVMFWGFTSTTALATVALQYLEDLCRHFGASDAEKEKWQAEMMPWPVLTMLAGFMLSPLFFSSLVQSQAGSFCVMGLTLPLLFQLPDVASTRQPVPSWSVAQLRPMLPVVLCAALQGVRNLCRETLLGPSLIIRFMPDYWSWAQMNVAGVFGGVVGQSMSLVMLQQPANPGFIAVLMALCPILFLIELMTSSYKVLLLATFCSALLKVLTAPMFWKICGLPDGQLQVCQQAFAFFDGVLGFVVPLSTLAVTTSVSPYGGAALLTVSGIVLPALAWRLPAEKRD